jgi:copper resistance protein D
VTELLDVFGLLAVLLRGSTLAFQSLVIGGTAFLVFVSRPAACKRWLTISALALAATELIYLFVEGSILMGTTGMPLGEVAGAYFFLAGAFAAASALGVAWLSRTNADRALLIPSTIILTSSVMTSHSTARVHHAVGLGLLTAAHQIGVGAWIGGIPFLLIALASCKEMQKARIVSERFSRVALISVALLSTSGFALSGAYTGSAAAIYGTTYGVMLAAKVILFAGLLTLGALNYFLVRRLHAGAPELLGRLRRFGEAEIGAGFTVILLAASLTSQPPAVDLTAGRLTLAEIAEAMAPRPPRMSSPPLSELSPASPLSPTDIGKAGYYKLESYVPGSRPAPPDTPADIAWSEYNHHWSGLILLATGLLAVASRTGRFPWARNWPLMFFGLAIFLFLRADSENWPLGPRGFWESFVVSEVLQHRVFLALIIGFALFEWKIQTGRLKSKRAALVFPLMCSVGGALMFTHSHSLANVRSELLVELSHLPIGLLAVALGWSRWIEVRLPGDTGKIPGRIWPVCLVLVGIVLIFYRES